MNATWKTPPVLKVLEALGALADGRVNDLGGRKAGVSSSDGSKTYEVTWSEQNRAVSSNDNASYWQGYLGYPGIACLMLWGQLPYDAGIAKTLAGIEWKVLNRKLRDHGKVISHLHDSKGIDTAAAIEFAEKVRAAFTECSFRRPDKRSRPPGK